MPKTVGFLLFNDIEELDFVGPWEIFSIWSKTFDGPKTITVSQNSGEIVCAKGLKIISQYSFSNCPSFDVLVVPGGWGTRAQAENAVLIDFIRERSKHCKYILGVCTGAFLLQKAGLLDHKQATTHWRSLERLRLFEQTRVQEKRFVQDGNLWTSAGISAGIDMSLAYIAHVGGDELAGKIQFNAEYYPLDIRYGSLHRSNEAPQYLKKQQVSGSAGLMSWLNTGIDAKNVPATKECEQNKQVVIGEEIPITQLSSKL
ncbi:MAG: DJ-1/PfpI family protein [Gammaproteobacteria bacterium]|nr:DJ-1/PfpI family protein [Gammaproteobacteria bacterium]